MNDDFEALAGYRPTDFACPLCGREVDRGCVSTAHAPSRRVGGKPITLTCRWCNSQMGTWYEADAVRMLLNRRASKSGVWTERLRAGSGDPGENLVGVSVTYDMTSASGPTISVRPAKPRSPASAYWGEQVRRIVADPSGTIRFEGRLPGPQSVGRALLYWAFLSLTSKVGYAFAGSPGGRVVADALLDRSSTVLGAAYRLQVPPIGAILREIEPSEPFIWLGGGVSDIEGMGWRFGDFLVILPWPTDSTGEIYRKLDARAGSGPASFGSGKVVGTDLLGKVYESKMKGPRAAVASR